MNVDKRLRDAFGAAAGTVRPEMIRPCPAPPPRRSQHRLRISDGSRRSLVPLAAACAVALSVAGVSIAAGVVSSSGQSRSLSGADQTGAPAVPASAAPPRYAVITMDETATPLTVWDTRAGRVTARIMPPQRASVFNQVAGTSDDREFVVTIAQLNGCGERLYRLLLDRQGRLASLTPLAIQPPQDVSLSGLAASANGRVIAYTGETLCGPGMAEIGVVNTATGQNRTWPEGAQGAQSLSLSADGRTLGFVQGSPASFSSVVTTTAMVMPTDAPAGPADQHSRVVLRGMNTRPLNLPGQSPVAISTDGSQMFACTEDDRAKGPARAASPSSPGSSPGSPAGEPTPTPVAYPGGQPGGLNRLTGYTPVTLRLYDTATSRQLRVLDTWGHPDEGCDLAPDASGRYLLVHSPPALGWADLSTGKTQLWASGSPSEISASAW
jgi:hypothetical protein